MTERERLIELLRNQNCPSPYMCDSNCKYAKLKSCYEERTADYLLDNGVIVPPCKVGDAVYVIYKDDVCEGIIAGFAREKNQIQDTIDCFLVMVKKGCASYKISFFEDEFYLTREEAEKALKERGK